MSQAATDRGTGPRLRLGATVIGASTRFELWAPRASTVEVEVRREACPLARVEGADGATTWVGLVEGFGHGGRYRFRLDGGDWVADPASRWQPDGIDGPSAVVDESRFAWTDDGWRGVSLDGTVFYEMNVRAFTTEGTFDAAISHLDRLRDIGVTTLQLLPVAASPPAPRWAYNGALPFAVEQSYGGPEGLARFVEAAHQRGLAVMLDVVYQQLAPGGTVLEHFGPYFTAPPFSATSPLPTNGAAGAEQVTDTGNGDVRRYIVENALGWIRDYHLDGIRLDAISTRSATSAGECAAEVTAAVHAAADALGRAVLVTVASGTDDLRAVQPIDHGGWGCDAVWDRDVHHALRVTVRGDDREEYQAFSGVADIAGAWQGRRSADASADLGAGTPSSDIDLRRLVVCMIEHRDIIDVPASERARARTDVLDPRRRLAVSVILLSPFTPMLFMGQEYGERPPEAYADRSRASDPLRRGALDRSVATREPHRPRLAMYAELLRLRREHEVLTSHHTPQEVSLDGDVMTVTRWGAHTTAKLCFNFSADPVGREAEGAVVFDSDDHAWGGPGRRRDVIGPWSARFELAP